jgi:Ca-activated chloride channel family protein
MKYRYSKFVASLADEVDLQRLLERLSDLLLSSGFDNPWDPQSDDDRAMQALHDAILDALLNGGALSDEMVDKLLSHDGTPESIQQQRDQLEQLVQQLIERLGEQGYISPTGKPEARVRLRGRRASK